MTISDKESRRELVEQGFKRLMRLFAEQARLYEPEKRKELALAFLRDFKEVMNIRLANLQAEIEREGFNPEKFMSDHFFL